MKKLVTLFSLLSILILSCNVQPKEIRYGEDGCHFCQMTIVDKQHAAQIVSKKGKSFNFDATECMVNYLAEIEAETVGLLLVTDYNNPESLIDAYSATYIISEDIRSPMGANLSAVLSNSEADELLVGKSGTKHDWGEILNYLKEL